MKAYSMSKTENWGFSVKIIDVYGDQWKKFANEITKSIYKIIKEKSHFTNPCISFKTEKINDSSFKFWIIKNSEQKCGYFTVKKAYSKAVQGTTYTTFFITTRTFIGKFLAPFDGFKNPDFRDLLYNTVKRNINPEFENQHSNVA